MCPGGQGRGQGGLGERGLSPPKNKKLAPQKNYQPSPPKPQVQIFSFSIKYSYLVFRDLNSQILGIQYSQSCPLASSLPHGSPQGMFNLHPATWGLFDPRSLLPFYNSYVYHDIVISSRNSFRVHIPYMATKFSKINSRGRVTFWGSREYYTLLATWGLLDPRIINCGKTVNLL